MLEETLAGAPRAYPVQLTEGDFLAVVVEQRGVDVAVALADPAGETILEVDSPNGAHGPEPLAAVAGRAGVYRLTVRPLGAAAAGRFDVRVTALRPATGRDRLEARARRAFAEGERLRAGGGGGAGEAGALGADAAYRDALAAWRELGEDAEAARTLRRIGQEAVGRGELAAAERAFVEALALSRGIGDRAGEGRLQNDLGSIFRRLGRPAEALAAHRAALALARESGDPYVETAALGQLGLLYQRRGELQEALAAHQGAVEAWRRLGDRAQEASALGRLAATYAVVGEMEKAFDLLERALVLAREAGDRGAEAGLEIQLGWARYLAGDPQAALAGYDRALALLGGGDRLSEAAIFDRRGTALQALGRLDEAAAAYGRALVLVQAAGSRADEAHVLCNLGDLELDRGEPAGARERFSAAGGLFKALGERQGEAAALVGRARAERALGRLGAAREDLERAVAAVEALRGDLAVGELRTSYLASFHDPTEELVDLLMALDVAEPGRGHRAAALEASERGRARSLLDRLGAVAGQGWPVPEPVSVARLQGELLDEDTRMLVYALGEERSFLWVVGRGLLEAVPLAGRAELERLAMQAAAALAASREAGEEGQAKLATAALARAVLAPAARWLGEGRLVVVADGALLSVPFAALPAPGTGGGEPLLVRHEVVSLPSASVLTAQRRRRAGRSRPPEVVAVLADPVFAADDPRVGGGDHAAAAAPPPEWADLERSARDFDLDRFPRLPFTAQEAAAILALAPPDRRLGALAFDASREALLDGRLARFRIVHVASHGLLNVEHPERSGLVLSLVDRHGRPRDGFVRVGELFGLDLPADLVVLSACRTAGGKPFRGEGLVGLTWGFFAAGAERVVVSHWNVNDRATAELMERFYRGMLVEGLPAAAALRRAQLALRADPRWRAPYYWAPFTLAGDWR